MAVERAAVMGLIVDCLSETVWRGSSPNLPMLCACYYFKIVRVYCLLAANKQTIALLAAKKANLVRNIGIYSMQRSVRFESCWCACNNSSTII